MHTLVPRRLTPEGFGPYGEVLHFDAGRSWLVNGGKALRANTAARFDRAAPAEPVLAVYRSTGEPWPLRVDLLERHPDSSQAFVALSVEHFLVVVAPQDGPGRPDLRRAEAFVGRRGEGINYLRNVWHAPIRAIGSDGDFLMFMWERGTPDDCIVHPTREPLLVDGFSPTMEQD
ncbi:MAG: ureidoglycolate lyase [Microvirga sp.]